MKLWFSFIKELKLASRGFYFYIEIFMALLILAVLLFAVPENFESKQTEYIHLNLPEMNKKIYLQKIKKMDINGSFEEVEIEVDNKLIQSKFYETEDKKIYIINEKDDLIKLADKNRKLGAVIKLNKNNKLEYEYYLQGYESKRLKNLYLISHIEDTDTLIKALENQDVRPLEADYDTLTDRENIIPIVLTFNGALMGLFIIAAYIFLDKQEGVIKAYAVTASSVWQYLLSKIGVLLVTSILSSLIVLLPIMGTQPNYLLLLLLLLTTGFFASSLGLLIASFYDNIMQAFGTIYLFMLVIIIPNIAYIIPGWDPIWVKILPSYPILYGFKEILLKNGDINYILKVSLGFLVVGLILFAISNRRYKKTLTV
ncbi:MAG: ABC transporter permease [Halanaerobiales bacterium]|nr:ABC transporter permease [Halanaerobiales bacterium]